MSHHNEVPAVDDDRFRPTPSKKNTKRWCKGKVGREHKLALRTSQWLSRAYSCGWVMDPWRVALRSHKGTPFWDCHHEEFCSVCGKVMRHPWQLDDSECPDFTEDRTHVLKIVTTSGL